MGDPTFARRNHRRAKKKWVALPWNQRAEERSKLKTLLEDHG
jgi:hypothetical protein